MADQGPGTSENRLAGRDFSWPNEAGARALFRAVCAGCKSSGDEFGDRVDAGLAAALSFLAEDPGLARGLVTLQGDAPALRAQRRWVARFGEILRGAAAEPQGVDPAPRFAGVLLIEGIRFQIGRKVLAGEATRLPELHPELLGVLLAFFREGGMADIAPAEASVLTGAQREAGPR